MGGALMTVSALCLPVIHKISVIKINNFIGEKYAKC